MHQPAFAAQRFLVVEDEPLITIDLQRLLEQEGATAINAPSVSRALRFVDTSPFSAGVIDIRLGDNNAGLICDELGRRRVPFIFYTGQADAVPHRWRSIPVVGKPTLPSVIIGAIKYAISADKADMLAPISNEADDVEVRGADQRIAEGEMRVLRISRLVARLQVLGFDTSVAQGLLVTMTENLDLMRELRRQIASERWRSPTVFRAKD